MAICLFCKKNEVPLNDWNRRCTECREKQKKKDEIEQQQLAMGIGKRTPAAVITLENGEKVFVDKFGKETDNPGYDLKNDPRGWGFTGKSKPERKIIK
jgi:hypothetical protein